MFETIVLLMGALPFIVGLYALRKIKDSDDEGPDDQPPPPDPDPPLPVLPPSPRSRRIDDTLRAEDRSPVGSRRDRVPHRTWTPARRAVHGREPVTWGDEAVRWSSTTSNHSSTTSNHDSGWCGDR